MMTDQDYLLMEIINNTGEHIVAEYYTDRDLHVYTDRNIAPYTDRE